MTPPRAILFDMDETLVNTRLLWQDAERALFARFGRAWSEELAASYKGRNVADVATIIHDLCGAPGDAGQVHRVFRDFLFEAFEAGPIAEMPGAIACVRSLAPDYPLAVASGSPLPLIELALERMGVRRNFSALVSSESVARGKPEPDVFLAAAEALGLPPESCFVVEDSLAGARAARAAGMACLVVPSVYSDQMPEICARVFSDLFSVERVLKSGELWKFN